jgi:hypothetical protein
LYQKSAQVFNGSVVWYFNRWSFKFDIRLWRYNAFQVNIQMDLLIARIRAISLPLLCYINKDWVIATLKAIIHTLCQLRNNKRTDKSTYCHIYLCVNPKKHDLGSHHLISCNNHHPICARVVSHIYFNALSTLSFRIWRLLSTDQSSKHIRRNILTIKVKKKIWRKILQVLLRRLTKLQELIDDSTL